MNVSTAYVLVGPTASGKSAIAQYIAERQGWAILSADSMLIYKGMDVGTAKPSIEERSRVPYGGVDLVAADERCSVWDYRQEALAFFAGCKRQGLEVIVTGGSGLYVKALTHGIRTTPGTDAARAAYWQSIHDSRGVAALQSELERLHPGALGRLKDPENPRRLVRALALAEGTHSPVEGTWQRVAGSAPLVGLEWSPEELAVRIEIRVRRMFAAGLVQEVEGLLSSGRLSPTACQAIGYAEVSKLLGGEMTETEAIEKTVVRTRQLAKKQRTWFRHQSDVCWMEMQESTPVDVAAERVLDAWREHGPTRIEV